MKKAATLLVLVFLVLHPLFTTIAVPSLIAQSTENGGATQDITPVNIFQEVSDIEREIRVALYDETNTTTPSYSYSGSWTTNVTLIESLLVNAGFEVKRLTAADIDGTNVLRTAFFDVFVMVDNNPRESITREVLDFWRGGGGILGFDGVASFLCYFGVMVPAMLNNHGYGVKWTYQSSMNHTVATRHPISQQSMIGDKFTDNSDWATFDWSSLQSYDYSDEYRMITTTDSGDNWVSTLARDTLTGGRVVHTFGDCNPISEGHDQMIIDAIDWLCPRPKARLVFDYSHRPYFGIDKGDPDLGYDADDRYAYFRDLLVERSYTVDKLFKSPDGNLTTENLAPYDVLLINTPYWNFTAAEVAAVTSWVAEGGGLILLGEVASFSVENTNINYLLSGFDMWLTTTNYVVSPFTTTANTEHPTMETAPDTYYSSGVYVNVTGDAYPLWYHGSYIVNAAQEYGRGRVFLAGDINFIDWFYIVSASNREYAINLVNWLSSGPAPVLLYTDEGSSSSYYRGPVATALNELGIDYYLTFQEKYLNLSLHLQDWYLVIVDNPWYAVYSHHSSFREYIASGGRFLMSSYLVDVFPTDPLWAMLGFEYVADVPDDIPLYIWDVDAPVFNRPHDYGAANFTPTDDIGDMGDNLTVFDNATALAGFTDTPQAGNAAIVLRNDGKTLYNAYLIDQFWGDNDDSTYADNYELWLNEIAYMLRPTISKPADVEYEEGTTGHSIVWNSDSFYPLEYLIERNSDLIAHYPWDGGAISISIDGLAIGTYIFEITVSDRVGYTESDTVTVVVTESITTTTTTTTTITTTMDGTPYDPTLVIVALVGVGVAIVLIVILQKKRNGK
ncbi:MAG: hypothetical protein JW779_14845 [Candidatus Thorarchaeota archaeon]|nr:hypothetical protein [Candidatus Thorarchaeota archaeon]